MKTIASKIKEKRTELGFSQNALAALTGVSGRSIFAYEAGQKTPRPSTIVKLSAALGVPAKYLMDDSLERPEDAEKEKYVSEARSRIGEQGAVDIQALLEDNIALFAGGEISQTEKDTFFEAVMRAYINCKDKSKNGFTAKTED